MCGGPPGNPGGVPSPGSPRPGFRNKDAGKFSGEKLSKNIAEDIGWSFILAINCCAKIPPGPARLNAEAADEAGDGGCCLLDFLLFIGVEWWTGPPWPRWSPPAAPRSSRWDDGPRLLLLLSSCSVSMVLLAHSARPRICKDSASLINAESMCCGTLASPLYIYSTNDLRFSNSTSFIMTTGCLSFRNCDLNMFWKKIYIYVQILNILHFNVIDFLFFVSQLLSQLYMSWNWTLKSKSKKYKKNNAKDWMDFIWILINWALDFMFFVARGLWYVMINRAFQRFLDPCGWYQ